jgi:saccharopine dehydrogenase (NAD+, L-lysine-forming)
MKEHTRFLILGGYGFVGKLLAKYLLEESTTTHLILGGRNLEKARAFAKELGNELRVSTIRVDATDRDSLRLALKDANVDFLLNAAPTSHATETVIKVALEAKVDYLDLQLSSEKMRILKNFESEIKESGLCFITEAGFHPGLPSAMVRYTATQMDSITSALGCGYLNMGKDLPYSEAVDELMEAFIHYQAQVFKNGKWTKPGSWDMRNFNMGEEIGERMCYSLFLEEFRELPKMYPTLRDTGFYMSGSNWLADIFVFPIVMLGLKIAPQTLLRPLGKFMWWGMQQSPPPFVAALQVEATGEKDGKDLRFQIRVEHKDAYEMTVIPVVACLAQYLDGSIREPGLHIMGQVVEPKRLFEDMERLGIRVVKEVCK